MRKISFFIVVAFFLVFSFRTVEAAFFDFSDWDALLKKYTYDTTKENVHLTSVKYIFLKNDKQFKDLISKLEKFPVSSLESYNEKLSFWINVYNIMAVKIIADHYPVKSIKNIGGWLTPVWNKNAGIVGGKAYSLNDIEHRILRKMGDPHIHAAIVCASVSCPNLATKSYKPDELNSQLDYQMERLLANEAKGFFVHQTESAIYISQIFNWFKKDFQKHGGVLTCIKKHAPIEARQYLKYVEKGSYSIKYFDFNWNLNE
ncbi:MAG: DUF547 domain-containing protein [Nitrospinota bacterium]|jgi:hypothetical protein|nr:DUF547 domain-containing protein [Nitrospinota bacterium]MDP7581258.1 DUF547 domain-containing protein [Nitrospinota bacterium]HJN03183.1 DUF547 domain-containing protein [Nitrospinota bacterium]